MTFTPTPACYADPDDLKRVLGQKESSAASVDVLRTACTDATTLVVAATGRTWCVDPAADPQTLIYDAPLASVLYTADLADPTGVTVAVAGDTLDPAAYTWQRRSIYGAAPHAYALRLATGTWYALAGAAPNDAVTLTDAVPATTLTPPGVIVQATLRIAAALYKQRAVAYQQQSGGTEEIGFTPPPEFVINSDAALVLGPWVHPRRPLGRP